MSLMMRDFEFSRSDKEYVWKMGVVEAPTINGKHTLPMKVKLASN